MKHPSSEEIEEVRPEEEPSSVAIESETESEENSQEVEQETTIEPGALAKLESLREQQAAQLEWIKRAEAKRGKSEEESPKPEEERQTRVPEERTAKVDGLNPTSDSMTEAIFGDGLDSERLEGLEETRRKAEAEAQSRMAKEHQLKAEIDALRKTEADQLKRIEAARLARQVEEIDTQIKALRKAEANDGKGRKRSKSRSKTEEERLEALTAEVEGEVQRLTKKRQRLMAKLEEARKAELGYLTRIEEAKARLKAHEEMQGQLAEEEARLQEGVEQDSDEQSKEQSMVEAAIVETEEIEPYEENYSLSTKGGELNLINIDQQDVDAEVERIYEAALFVESDLNKDEEDRDEEGARSLDLLGVEKGIDQINDEDPVISGIRERLKSEDQEERVAALAELSKEGDPEAFKLITMSFDDPVTEVRNAAARALYDLRPDRADSFTMALREGSPERRRKIGTSLEGSGIAQGAIDNLVGESREKTYEAFSILFLMAKAGGVQPLLNAIQDHPNVGVRLAVIKLLAFSNQSEIMPSFRRLAVRGSLPPEVRSAVMEAIHEMNTRAQASTQTLA